MFLRSSLLVVFSMTALACSSQAFTNATSDPGQDGGLGSGGSGGNVLSAAEASLETSSPEASNDSSVAIDAQTADSGASDASSEAPSIPAVCGDGHVGAGEACDDMNVTSGDGCFHCRKVVHVAVGRHHACALIDDGAMKCWGWAYYGQLGQGDQKNRGELQGQMSDNLPPIDLGKGRTATAMGLGGFHTCAVLDNGSIKCWGLNTSGQLGQGDTKSRGDQPGQMGDNLDPVPLGTGRLVTAAAAAESTTCALLNNGTVKCWSGEGQNLSSLGDNLHAVDLGSRKVKSIAAGGGFVCALLEGGAVKCWGDNAFGQLGQGDLDPRGTTLGDTLKDIDVGAGRTALAIAAGDSHACAVLDDGTAKCWGSNEFGQLGQGDKDNRGDSPGEMGDNLKPISLGVGVKVKSIAAGPAHTCAILDNATVKCWGRAGSLGLGVPDNVGDDGSEMGEKLPIVLLGTGRTVKEISAQGDATCVLLDNDTLKCWGLNNWGQLGLGDTSPRGDNIGQMGDSLPTLLLP
jgi:cysteine-rich repeat protein